MENREGKDIVVANAEPVMPISIMGKEYYINYTRSFMSEVSNVASRAGLSRYQVKVNDQFIDKTMAMNFKCQPTDRVVVQPYDEAGR